MAPAPSSVLPHGPVFSWYRDHAGLIYTAGHASVDLESGDITTGDLAAEARASLDNLQRTLERAGSSLDRVLKVTVYLTDMGDYRAFNDVYAQYFRGDRPPARTCVEVRRLPYNFRIEIDAVAYA